MFWDDKKRALVRAAVGGLIGVAVLIPLGGLFNDLVSGGLISMGFHTPFRLVSADLEWRVGSAPLALVIQLALYFLLGAAAGVSTLPFADDGPTLILRSLAHFALTAGLLTLTCTLLGWAWSWQAMGVYLVLLAAVYLLIWLGRWVGACPPCWACSTPRTCRCSGGCCSPGCCCRWAASSPGCPWGSGKASVPCTPWCVLSPPWRRCFGCTTPAPCPSAPWPWAVPWRVIWRGRP